MKTAVITAIATLALAGTGAARIRAGRPELAAKHTITAYVMDNRVDRATSPVQAEELASQIFATAGIAVDWRRGRPVTDPTPSDLTVVIDIRDQTPAERMPGALAFAEPYEGIHLVVFYDRVRKMNSPRPESVLGHVLAHEVTHLLEGVARHSKTGVMKARYTHADAYAMLAHPLPFAPEDMALIEVGIEKRLAGAAHGTGVTTEAATPGESR